MKRVLTYQEFLNESATIEFPLMIDALKLIEKNVSIDAAKFAEFRGIFIKTLIKNKE